MSTVEAHDMTPGFWTHVCTYTAFAAETVEAVRSTGIRIEMSQFLDAGPAEFEDECERKSESMRSKMMLKPPTKFETTCMTFGGKLLAPMCAIGSYIAASGTHSRTAMRQNAMVMIV
jgi:hypothetical protein